MEAQYQPFVGKTNEERVQEILDSGNKKWKGTHMQYKMSKSQWQQIGMKAEWLKTAVVTHELGSEGFGAPQRSEEGQGAGGWSIGLRDASDEMKKFILYHVNQKASEERQKRGDRDKPQYTENDILTLSGDLETQKTVQETYIPGGRRIGYDANKMDYAEDDVESKNETAEKSSSARLSIIVRMRDGGEYSIIKTSGPGQQGEFSIGRRDTIFQRLINSERGYFQVDETETPNEASAPQKDRSIWSRMFGRKASSEDFQKVMGRSPKQMNSNTHMQYKMSKSQWQQIGMKAGWLKTSSEGAGDHRPMDP